jgi:hypothetical protein
LSVSSDDPRSVKFIAMLPDPHHFVPVNKAGTCTFVQLYESEKKGVHRDTPLAKELHRHTHLSKKDLNRHNTPLAKELHRDPPLTKKEYRRDIPLAKKGLHRHTPRQGVSQRHTLLTKKGLHRDKPLTKKE